MFQLKFVWKHMKGYRGSYIFAMVTTCIFSVMILSNSIFFQKIVDEVVMELPKNNFTREYLIDHLIVLVIGLIGFSLAKTAINYIGIMQYERSSQQLIHNLRTDLYRNIGEQDKEFFNRNRTGDIMTRLTGDLDLIRHAVSWIARMAIENVLTFVIVIGYMFAKDPIFTIALLVITPIIAVLSKKFSKLIHPMYVDLRERQSELNTAAQENISGNRVVKAFAQEAYECEKFDEKNDAFRKQNLKATLTWLKFFPYIDMLCQSVGVVVLILGGIFMISGRMTPGTFMAFNSLSWLLTNPMKMIGMLLNDTQRFFASCSKIIELYYSKSTIANRHDSISHESGKVLGDIKFKNVSLDLSGTTVLKNINLTIKRGQTVAIMGPTGCGKTSLINLIPRLYDCTEGEVDIGGTPVGLYNLQFLRHSIGLTTQEVFLFSDTVDSNIAYGNSKLPEDEVKKFAKIASADFIYKMSDEFNTLVGERGTGLSGGQKQRIALARAIAVKPSILILDDTTSAVDLETEKYIQDGLNSLEFECTKIIIAQRISSTKDADMIITMDNGKIKQVGTHKELIAVPGYYQDVYKLQNGDE